MGLFTSKPDYSKIRTKKKKQEEKPRPAWVKWVTFSVVLILYLAFLYWVKSWWGLLVVPFIFDALNTVPTVQAMICNRRRPAAADAVVNGSRAARRQLVFWECAMAAADAVTSGRPAVVNGRRKINRSTLA